MRAKAVLVALMSMLVVAVLATTASAAEYHGQITEATANLASKEIKVSGTVECTPTPGGYPSLGGEIPFTDGCAPGEEEQVWSEISLVVQSPSAQRKCRPGGFDTPEDQFAKTQTLRTFQPEHTISVPFSFTARIKILRAKYLCLEHNELSEIPVTGSECSPVGYREACFFRSVIAATKIKWVGRKPVVHPTR